MFVEHLPTGMNTVVKLAPHLPLTESFDSNDSLSDEDLELLVSMGMSVLRMNVPWSAVEVHFFGSLPYLANLCVCVCVCVCVNVCSSLRLCLFPICPTAYAHAI
jgi:hypothetical protein